MRLTHIEHAVLSGMVTRHFGAGCDLYLFGSRIHDDLRGGDIDLLVDLRVNTNGSDSDLFQKKLHCLTDIHFKLGEQKIDMIISCGPHDKRVIVQAARQQGIRL